MNTQLKLSRQPVDPSEPTCPRQTARREAILDVARANFLKRGFSATSMAMIAAQLGGSKGTLYNYFRSKEELFAAVMQRECANQALSLFSGPRHSDTEEMLHALGRGFLDFILSDDAMAIQRVIIAEGERFPDLGALFYDNGPRLVSERLEGLFTEMTKAGDLAIADVSVAAEQFKDLVLSSAYRRRLWGLAPVPDASTLDRQVRAAVGMFLKMYGSR